MKSATAYHVEFLDAELSFETLEAAFSQLEYKPLVSVFDEEKQTLITGTSGFSRVFEDDPDAPFVERLPNGFAFAVTIEEKVVPDSAIKAEQKKALAEYARNYGEQQAREDKAVVEEGVRRSLYARALSKVNKVVCYYHTASHYLIVPTTSSTVGGIVMGRVLAAQPSIKTQTIHVSAKKQLTAGLIAWLDEREGVNLLPETRPFGDFAVKHEVTLKGDGRTVTIKASRKGEETVGDLSRSLRDALEYGLQVESLRLELGSVSFLLQRDFRLSSISIPKGAMMRGEDYFEHTLQTWAADLEMVVEVFGALCSMLGWKPKDENPQPESEGGQI